MGACAAQGSGRIRRTAPHRFQLVVAQAAQVSVLLAVLQLDERLRQRVLRPALRIGLLCVDEKTVECRQHLRQQREDFRIRNQLCGLGHQKVVAVGERLAQVLDCGCVRSGAGSYRFSQRFQLRKLLVEAARRRDWLRQLAGMLRAHGLILAELQDSSRRTIGYRPHTTKYLACGWCTTTALVLCSGSRWNCSVRRTPMFSSGLSRWKIFVWSSKFGQAG